MTTRTTGDDALVRLVTLGGAAALRPTDEARLQRLGLRVDPVRTTRPEPPDLVVVHHRQGPAAPGDRCVAAVVAASTARVTAPLLVLTDRPPTAAELVAAVAAGARGWLADDLDDAALGGAVRDVLAGSFALTRSDVGVVVRELERRSRRTVRRRDGRLVQLSDREWEVLERLAAGSGGAEVAATLGVSATAVRGYVASAVRRLGAVDRADAVVLFRSEVPRPLAG